MSEFYPLRHNRLSRDISLLKKLELKQKQLEDKAFNSMRMGQCRNFKAHPKRIQSDSDTTDPSTPRTKTNFSSSTSNLVYRKPPGTSDFQETKQRAHNFHKLLHEKLSIIDSNPSEKSDYSEIGDHYRVPQQNIGDRYQSSRIKNKCSNSSIGSLSPDEEFSATRCKSGEIRRKIQIENSRTENNYSVASKTTSGGERRSAGSRLSSQQSFCPRGIPVSVFERKFKVVVTKSLQNVADIRNILAKGIVPPDGEEDESRRLVKVKEFSNRFSRNYLYPLARQLKDLDAVNQLNPMVVNQKLLSTYQILHNALQAYQTHLPTSLGDCTYNQLNILMSNIAEVCRIHKSQLKEGSEDYLVEFIDTFKINAQLAIQKVEECLAVRHPILTEAVLKSGQSKISLTKYGDKNSEKQKIAKSGVNRSKFDKRLSMYTMTASFRKDAPWKRAVENLAKKNFNVKSKYRTATYKHRPPIQKEPEIVSIPKFKSLFALKQSGVPKQTRLNSPINEDSIKTMVETVQNGETLLEKEEWENMEKKTDDIKPEVS